MCIALFPISLSRVMSKFKTISSILYRSIMYFRTQLLLIYSTKRTLFVIRKLYECFKNEHFRRRSYFKRIVTVPYDYDRDCLIKNEEFYSRDPTLLYFLLLVTLYLLLTHVIAI